MKSKLIPIGFSLACASAAMGGNYAPIPLNPSSYNADVVVEASATPKINVVTTASVDQGLQNNANTWGEIGFDPGNPGNGLPPAGTIFTAVGNPNYSFIMPPSYTLPNGILIDTVVTNGTFSLVTPTAYTKLSFIGSGGNGGDVIGVTVHHADGSVEGVATGGTAYTFGCPDWFNGTINVAYIANERSGSTVNRTFANAGSNNPRIYFRDITLTNTTSAVTSVDLSYYSGGSGSHNCVFGVSGDPNGSGTVVPIAVTGYAYDFVVEASASQRGVVNGTNGSPATTSSMDSDANTGNSWYEQGFNLNNVGNWSPIPAIALKTGLPHPGATVTNASGDHAFVMPPTYVGNDAVYLSPTIPTATITFASPTAASGLSFLASAGNGPVTPQVVVHHQDGSSETNSLTVFDWFNTGVPYGVAANGRVDVGSGQLNNVSTNLAGNLVPRLDTIDLSIQNVVSPITSIDLTYVNTGGRMAIFAVAGTAGAVVPSFIVSPNAVGSYPGPDVAFTALATGTAPITYHWQKGTNGVWVTLADGGNISGSTTTNLVVGAVTANDDADYRAVATNPGATVYSSAAHLTIISPLTAVTTPGDPVTGFGGTWPAAESVDHAVDGVIQKYLNFGKNGGAPFVGPVGFTVAPSIGRTIVTGLRWYTANDTVGRDPADYILEGSNDGGSSYVTISSGNLALPDGRNGAGGTTIDPTTMFMQQVLFANTKGYTSYRVTIPHIKDSTQNSMQIGEVEILGVIDTSPVPSVSTPASVNAFDGATAITFSTTATPASPQPALHWQRKTGAGAWVNLTDGGNISGSTSSTLTLAVVHFSDASAFRVIASNSAGSATSAVATLTIFSSLTDVTQPGDTITGFGDDATGPNDPTTLFNNVLDNYLTRGSGINASAGFPPFQGPVGVIVTPAVGATVLSGIRIYTGSGGTANDPIDYALEGSDDAGVTFAPIASGPLALPAARNTTASLVDPTQSAVQEILFSNTRAFTSYRVSFFNVADNVNNSSLQLGEIELLGVNATGVSPSLTVTPGAGGSLNITSSGPGTLQSATSLGNPTVWTDVGPITGTVNIVPAAGTPQKFYRVKVQ